MAKKNVPITWTPEYIESLALDEASIPAARKVLTKGGFGTVEPTTDGRGWWVVCQGITDTYQVTVQRAGTRFEWRCNCPSPKIPCKHALALLLHLLEHPELRVEVESPKKATLDFESLVRAAFAHPDDDLHRLVLADYLEENDQPDRAALIRYQCEQAHLKSNAARYKELTKLIEATETRVREQIGALPNGIEYTFRRGFMRLYTNHFHAIDSFPVRFVNLFHDGWVEVLATPINYNFYTDVLPFVAQVGELDVSSPLWIDPGIDSALIRLVAETADARTTGRLSRVTVQENNRAAFDRLLRIQRGEPVDPSADLDPVRHYNFLTPRLFGSYLQFGRFSGARDLFLGSSDKLGEKEIAALLTADLSALRHLRLNGWKFTKGAMETLVNSPALAKLATLSLRSCRVQAPAVSALVRSPLFATLKTIDLTANTIGKEGVAAFLKADVPTKLKWLSLTYSRLDATDRKRLKNKYGERLKV